MKHGAESYFFKKEGWVKGSLFPIEKLLNSFKKYCPWYASPKPDPIDRPDGEQPTMPRRLFCRLFDAGEQPDADGLVELGMAMETETITNIDVAGDSNIPGGYTYLGQFIDHDITSDSKTVLEQTGSVEPENMENTRSPALDLDNVYGKGPELSSEMYEADGIHLKIGSTSATIGGEPGAPIAGGFPNDLPRKDTKEAMIGDGRNDENLAVAQTHLAFLKFHNKKVDELASNDPSLSGNDLFEAARSAVILQYQSIILTDFLPRLIEPEVLQDVLDNGRKFYTDEFKDCMPIEFSVGAYRLGHSMVRPVYEWNRVFNSSGINATFELLFEFSQVSGSRGDGDDPFFGKPTLPSNWIIDWTRFYDFTNVPGIDNHADSNVTRKIDTKLSFALKTLPEFQKMNIPPMFISLATRNLLRSRLVSLPSGQAVATAMQSAGIAFDAMTESEILGGDHDAILQAHGFHQQTPLWYYVLREAKVKHNGNSLGPVGSRILAEVFIGLIANSEVSVLDQEPGLTFSMPELLAVVDDINPLGNE